jgi:hypothetical protein
LQPSCLECGSGGIPGRKGEESLWLMVVDTLDVDSLSWITLEPLSQDGFLGAGPLSWMAFKLLSQCIFENARIIFLCSYP